MEAMGLEPTNLLTASQALYQLSYAPSGPATLSVGSRRHVPPGAGPGPVGATPTPPEQARRVIRSGRASPTLVTWHGPTTSARWSASGSATGPTRAPTRSTTTTPARSSTRCACTPTRPGRPTRATSATTPSATWLVRYQTMQGNGVLSPIGFDSFGLPAENAAIKTGTHPRIFTEARIAELKASLIRLGAVYDWRREVRSHDPEYMQVEPGHLPAASRRPAWPTGPTAPVNWCPGCQTVLANEQVLPDGTCERSGDLVVKRDLEQWFFRITALRRRAARRPRRPRVARAGQGHAAQLDRPLRGRRVRPPRGGPTRPGRSGSSPPAPTPASA